MTLYIKLLSAGENTGPFNLYSDTDGFLVPFLEEVSKEDLVNGLLTNSAYVGTTQVKIWSRGICTNSIIVSVTECTTTTTSTTSEPTTTTTTTSTTTTSTTTTAIPVQIYGYCYYTGRGSSSDNYSAACSISTETTDALYGINPGINIADRVYRDIVLVTPFDGHNEWWKMEFGASLGNVWAVKIDNNGYCTDVWDCGAGSVCPPS